MKILVRIVILMLIVGAASAGVWYWQTHKMSADPNKLVLYGNVDIRQVELAINGNERIAEILAEEGDHVTKGQLLAKLQTERLEFAVQRANAVLEMQRQVVARLDAGSRQEEIAKAQADVEAAKAISKDAKRAFERNKNLHETNAISQQEFDDVLAETNDVYDDSLPVPLLRLSRFRSSCTLGSTTTISARNRADRDADRRG